jgi:hypothetical protein
MSICSRCGNQIEFRYVNGRCIPLHLHGGCGESSSVVVDFSGHNVCHESSCFGTRCPKCGDSVFFVRHNGGSVWLDAPLGPPWHKHPCFDEQGINGVKSTLLSDYQIDASAWIAARGSVDEGFALGVVKSTKVQLAQGMTEVTMDAGEALTLSLNVKHKAGFLLSKLCVLDENAKAVYALESPTLRYAVLRVWRRERVTCEHCGRLVGKHKMNKHMKKVHGIAGADHPR